VEEPLILRGLTCLTFDREHRVLRRDLRIDPNGLIDSLLPAGRSAYRGEPEFDLSGRIALPGLIQTHVHLCQTLFRAQAEGMALEAWLQERIWPLEAAHDASTLRASARLGLVELLSGGTTTILDMGTTRHLEVLLESCRDSGIRAVTGLALMDEGDGIPPALIRDAEESLEESRVAHQRFPPGLEQRVTVCVAPRFIPSVSEGAWRRLVDFAEEADMLIHTHACETEAELAFTQKRTGHLPIAYLQKVGAAGPRLRAAHGVWLDTEDERAILRRSGTAIVHCPGSNGKLGSGTADVARLWDEGIPVGIGCDGAACNNRLDIFEELRRGAQAIASLHGAEAVDPVKILEMATRRGAELLGLESAIGSIEAGKSADLVVLNPNAGVGLWASSEDLHAQVLHGAGREQVEEVWIQGEQITRGGEVRGMPTPEILREADQAARVLKQRQEAG
jgi:cytosine/adenosine deaminase-related metal-dependent hydrolase